MKPNRIRAKTPNRARGAVAAGAIWNQRKTAIGSTGADQSENSTCSMAETRMASFGRLIRVSIGPRRADRLRRHGHRVDEGGPDHRADHRIGGVGDRDVADGDDALRAQIDEGAQARISGTKAQKQPKRLWRYWALASAHEQAPAQLARDHQVTRPSGEEQRQVSQAAEVRRVDDDVKLIGRPSSAWLRWRRRRGAEPYSVVDQGAEQQADGRPAPPTGPLTRCSAARRPMALISGLSRADQPPVAA